MANPLDAEGMHEAMGPVISGTFGGDSAFRQTCDAARQLGFPFVILAPVRGHPDAVRNWSATTYPKVWQETYVRKNHLPNNPVRHHALTTHRPFTWSSLEETLPDRERELFHDSRDVGMCNAVVVPAHGPHGLAIAMGFACEHDDAINPDSVQWLQFLAMRLFHAQDFGPQTSTIHLTPRESELMQRMAEGLDNLQLADVMNLSDNSVEWHLKNIYRKLGVRNRTAAVVKCLRLGLLDG